MTAEILLGDALTRLQELSAGSVECAVTSPPYWGQRDYGVAGQLGNELTPDAYIKRLVEVFREVRRVLSKDGTLWLNMGDTYAADRSGTGMPAETLAGGKNGHGDEVAHRGRGPRATYNPKRDCTKYGLKHKDLVGLPWMLAFALRNDGWYLRSDIIWNKPAPTPESVRDRCTKSHEYLFLLAKREKYYYDGDAIKEDALDGQKKNRRSVWTIPTQKFKGAHFAVMPEALVEPCILAGSKPDDLVLDPFSGSGTVGVVALRHGRNYVGIELNPEYAEISKERITAAYPQTEVIVK